MPAVTESTGNVETICQAPAVKVGDTVRLVFRALDDSEPPYTVKIAAPGGKIVVERVLRELPTGRPQSAPPLSFVAGAAGEHMVEVTQLYGSARGQATLLVLEAETPG